MNWKNNIWLLIVALPMIVSSCQYNKPVAQEKATLEKKEEMTEELVKLDPKENPRIKDDLLNAIYQQYLRLSEALINADSNAAREAGNAVALGANVLKENMFMANVGAKISMATDIEVQRSLFEELSNEMIRKIKASGISSGEIYIEHCPMALDDKGAAWLSNHKEIRNPYYGEGMMSCGEIKEILR